jgi:glycosyltransferase involved in cell wall biosynthesis
VKWAGFTAHRRELELSKQCDQIIVYSEYSKTELIRNGFEPNRIQIHVPIRCWGDGPVASFSDQNLILFAGQIIRGKGVDLLLKALAKVRTPFKCIILGDGNYRPHCQRLCARLNLADRVQFRGFVPPEELQEYYLDASVFAVPSVWPEPFGMVGPEAMRYGLPVVAFDCGGISEWLTDRENGFLVPWKDVNSFALRIEELLRNKELARKMGRNGLERVNCVYPAERQVDTLEQLFLALAGKAKTPSFEFSPVASEEQEANMPATDISAFPTSNCVEALTHSTAATL